MSRRDTPSCHGDRGGRDTPSPPKGALGGVTTALDPFAGRPRHSFRVLPAALGLRVRGREISLGAGKSEPKLPGVEAGRVALDA